MLNPGEHTGSSYKKDAIPGGSGFNQGLWFFLFFLITFAPSGTFQSEKPESQVRKNGQFVQGVTKIMNPNHKSQTRQEIMRESLEWPFCGYSVKSYLITLP